MRTYPIKDASGKTLAFEIDAQLIGWKLARALREIEGVSDVRPRRWWVGAPDVHVRFVYRGREYIAWEPWGDNSRWWIGPDDTDAPYEGVDELERAIAIARYESLIPNTKTRRHEDSISCPSCLRDLRG
jgi:hypothetical protein